MALGLIALVTPLLLVGLVVWAVHAARASRDEARSAPSLRRFLQYASLLAAVGTSAIGLSGLVELALPAQRVAGRASGDLALSLSLSLVALPAAAGLWRVMRRRLTADPEERASGAWSLYLAVATTVAVTVAVFSLVEVVEWAVAGRAFPPDAAARALVWGAVWAAHQRMLLRGRTSPTGTTADLTVLAGAAVGLLTLVTGVGSVLVWSFDRLYAALVGGVLAGGAPWRALAHSTAVAALGGALWWWQWLRQAAGAPRTDLWHRYLLGLPVLGGLLASVGAAATVLHAVAQWTVGVPVSERAAAHFAVLPPALAAGAVGVWAWAYHRAVLTEQPDRRRTEPERAYEYVCAAVGLVAAGAGVAVALVAAIEALAPAPLAATDLTGRATLVTAATLLVVGGPLWWAFWRRLGNPPAVDGEPERRSTSRRAYLFLLLGAAGVTALVSLVAGLFVVLREVFEGTLDAGVLRDVRVAVALTVTAGGVAAYHWTVYREDHAADPDDDRDRDRHVLLVAPDPDLLAPDLRRATGATVRTLRHLDAGPPDADADAVAQAVLASPHPRVLVVVDGGDVRVIPYQTS